MKVGRVKREKGKLGSKMLKLSSDLEGKKVVMMMQKLWNEEKWKWELWIFVALYESKKKSKPKIIKE